MSDFFYKEKMGPVFSPVISVKRDSVSPTVISAIDNLLSPSGNMFTRAETVKKLMGIEKMSLEQTAQAYVMNKMEIAAAAKALYQHPNTVRYRLTKIQKLLGMEDEAVFAPMISLMINLTRILSEEGRA